MLASSKPVKPSPPFNPTPPMTTQPVRPALNNVNTGVTFNNSMNPPRGSIENSSTGMAPPRTSTGKGPEQHQNINTGASWTTSGTRW